MLLKKISLGMEIFTLFSLEATIKGKKLLPLGENSFL